MTSENASFSDTMIEQNTTYGDAWTPGQIAEQAYREGNLDRAAFYGQIEVECYGDLDNIPTPTLRVAIAGLLRDKGVIG